MKKSLYLFIIILSTSVSVVTMVKYDNYLGNSKQYEEGYMHNENIALYNKDGILSKTINSKNYAKESKNDDDGISNTKYHLQKEELYEKEFNDDYKSEDKQNSDSMNASSYNENMRKANKSKKIYDEMRLLRKAESLEGYYYDNKENEQSVFKVSTGDIVENLTTSDKIKLLYVSMKLDKDNYKKVEEYLYAADAEDGVLKALKLLKTDLSKKEYEKVRKIATKFIDMDAAERLY